MNITCSQCKTKLNIPDHKIPKDKDASIACPKCKAKITIPAAKPAQPPAEHTPPASRLSFEDRLNALVCVGPPEYQKKLYQSLSRMGFDVRVVNDHKTAISKMEYHIYHLVVLDETFEQYQGTAKILDKMNTIDMSLRRRICLVLLSSGFGTNDNMASLHASVNNILHTNDIAHIESFITRSLAEHKNLYTVYNESLKQAGKA